MSLQSFEQLIQLAQNKPKKTVVVAAAHDLHALQAVVDAAQKGYADYMLVGNRAEILSLAAQAGLALNTDAIADTEDDAEAAKTAVGLVRQGKGDFLMKGGLGTATLLRAVLDKEHGLRGGGIMSHVMLVEVPSYHKLIAVTDGAMVPYPTFDQKQAILRNALHLFHTLGYEKPVVAALAAAETLSDKMPETGEAAQLKALAATGEFGHCVFDGPLSYDLTMSAESAAIKHFQSPVTGHADILLVPNIACGNVLCKCMVYTAGGLMAGCILGARVPIVLTSRGASAREKEVSILLAAAGTPPSGESPAQ